MDGSGAARKRLTEEQLAVVAYDGGHAIVEAVPGSGKTTVLLARLRRLVRQNRASSATLGLMYNKAAQVQFEARLRRACPNADALPAIRTFHSMGLQILRRLNTIGALPVWRLRPQGNAVDRYARRYLKSAWKRAGGAQASPSQAQFQEFLRFITVVKSQLGSPERVFEQAGYGSDCKPFLSAFVELWRAQQAQEVMFFDDLIYRPMRLLAAQPELWSSLTEAYDEILVDEAQDINDAQFHMVRGLAGQRAHVMAVGDPRQSIYSFRGARVDILTKEFAQAFAPCRTFPLSRTFRFGPRVALMADHLIEHNEEGRDRIVVAAPGNPDTTVERIALRPKKPSGIVNVLQPYQGASTLRRTAVLARNFSHLVPFEIELAEAGVPYHVYGREGLLFLPEIAALVCAVSLVADRWIIDPEDRERFIFSLLATPTPYVPMEDLATIAEQMEPNLSGSRRKELPRILRAVADDVQSSNSWAAKNLMERTDALRVLTNGSLARVPAATIVAAYIRMTHMTDVIKRSAATPERAQEALGTLTAFVQLAERAGSVGRFLDLLGPLVAHKEDKPPSGDHCMLTTLHRSKGLEWSLVMLVGLARGVFPSDESDQLEEDRRLAFVGMTRAVDRLILFHPEDKELEAFDKATGEKHEQRGNASQFLYECEGGLSLALTEAVATAVPCTLQARRDTVATKYLGAVHARQVTLAIDPELKANASAFMGRRPLPESTAMKVGDRVVHQAYGVCVIADVMHHPIYRVRFKDGREQVEVVTPANDWGLAG